MRLIDLLPKFPQYEDFPYTPDFECPECGKSGFLDYNWSSEKHVKPLLVGWCETNIGKMGVFECPVCGQKFRFHCTIGTWIADEEEFDMYLYYKARSCSNWEDIKKKLGDKD